MGSPQRDSRDQQSAADGCIAMEYLLRCCMYCANSTFGHLQVASSHQALRYCCDTTTGLSRTPPFSLSSAAGRPQAGTAASTVPGSSTQLATSSTHTELGSLPEHSSACKASASSPLLERSLNKPQARHCLILCVSAALQTWPAYEKQRRPGDCGLLFACIASHKSTAFFPSFAQELGQVCFSPYKACYTICVCALLRCSEVLAK